MLHQRHVPLFSNDEIDESDNQNDRDDRKDRTGKEDIHVNQVKLGAILYFPLIGIALTSCLGDMYHRNSDMHREPNTARSLLIDCPVNDPNHVWFLLVCCYLVMVVSIAILCHTMLGLSFNFIGLGIHGQDGADVDANIDGGSRKRTTARSTRMRVVTFRICFILIYCGMYHWDVCMGNMPYLKKKTAQVYLTCIVLFISSPTLSMPVITQVSKSSQSKPPRWPLFIIKMMIFIPYADAGWHKLHRGFSGSALSAALMDHYILFERPIALLLVKYPMLTSASAVATLIFECAGWILVFFDYDRVAAGLAISFHLGIYVAMNINYLLFWGCSFVFFFVPSIVSSRMFQRLVKRIGGKASVPVPLGCSFLVGIEGENMGTPSTATRSLTNEGTNAKSKRKRKSSVLMAVSCALVLTYKGLYPPKMMLPAVPQSLRPYFLAHLYEHISTMAAKPFNSYNMFSNMRFPVARPVAFLVLNKRMTSQHTEHEPAAPYRRVKWTTYRDSDDYFFLNMLEGLNQINKDRMYTLQFIQNSTVSQRNVTRCNIFACLAQRYILGETAGDGTKDGWRGARHEMMLDGPWYVDSIELVDERFFARGAVVGDNNGDDVVELSGGGSLGKKIFPFCALDIGDGSSERQRGDVTGKNDGHLARYKGGSCGEILTELDASAMSVDASPGENPFNIKPALPHNNLPSEKNEPKMWTVTIAMLIMGYKTYLLAS